MRCNMDVLPTISVLIPTFNGARFLRGAIESVLSQGIDDLEIIVTDDNSSDDTAAVVTAFSDPRIKFHRNLRNLGAQGNWNLGLSLALGKYIKLLPQDDLIRPGSLIKQVAVLDADPQEKIVFVFGARDIINAKGRVIARRGLNQRQAGRVSADVLVKTCVRAGTNKIGEPGAVLFRRSAAAKIGRFDGSQPYVIDLDYWFRLLNCGDAWYLAESVSAFRISRGSWSIAIGRNQAIQYAEFLDRMKRTKIIRVQNSDVMRGKAIATINNCLRMIIYRLLSQ